MARSIPGDRLRRVIGEATRLFIIKGFRRTQMSDVAKAVGVSAGSMYTYVESKEALFYWCLRRAVGDGPPDGMVPLPGVSQDVMLKEVDGALDAGTHLPHLKRALRARPQVDAEQELSAIIGEIYDATVKTRVLQALVERSAMDVPGLADSFFVRHRRGVLTDLTRFLETRSKAGLIRHLEHPAVTARLILETQSWFARNRYGDPDAADIDDDSARATVIEHLIFGLVP